MWKKEYIEDNIEQAKHEKWNYLLLDTRGSNEKNRADITKWVKELGYEAVFSTDLTKAKISL